MLVYRKGKEMRCYSYSSRKGKWDSTNLMKIAVSEAGKWIEAVKLL